MALQYYMGWDSHEQIAHEVAAFSCLAHSSAKVDIHALKKHVLIASGAYKRDLDKKQNTEFTYLRFLVPYLCGYSGWALFTDDDMLWRGDIQELFAVADDKYAVMCVKHDPSITCLATTKLAGAPQEMYPRKNWSSVMLINCAHPASKTLTPELVMTASPQFLHRMYWAVEQGKDQDDESLIGELPSSFNWLVDWYPMETAKEAKLVHFTDGGPWYPDYRTRVNDDGTVGVAHQQEWQEMCKKYEATLAKPRLLGAYERFTCETDEAKKPALLPGYPNSDAGYWDWTMEEEWQAHIKEEVINEEISAAKNAAKK